MKTAQYAPWAIAAFRVVVGFLFLCHGTSSLFSWPVAPWGGETASFGEWPSWWAAIIQLVGGALIMAGIGTRTAAFIGSGSMAVAYFWKHQPDGALPIQNDGDSVVLFCWALLLLVFLGPGKAALDSLFGSSVRSDDEAPTDATGSRTDEPAASPA